MRTSTITLVGRAHSLRFVAGIASWKIAVNRGQQGVSEFTLQSDRSNVLEKFEAMDEGRLIGVIAELPPARKRKPGAPLTVQRLELLGKPQGVAHV